MTPIKIRANSLLQASLTVFLLVSTAACHGPQAERAPLATVQQVDLERYLGRWYEIAKIPNRFQRQCSADTTANYARNADGTIAVVNRCLTREGQFDEARAIARVADPRTNARLEVSFFSLFGWRPVWGDYWVLVLGPDYEYAVVGEPGRRYGWILARTQTLSDVTRNAINQRLRELGYMPERFENSPHTVDR
jgi:apolipoprotein D and lipocalin family protein